MADKERIITLGSSGKCYLHDIANNIKYELKKGRRYVVKADSGNLIFSGRSFKSPVKVVSMEENSLIDVKGKKYRGNIILMPANNSVSAINELDIEPYLYGVLPKEVISSWPKESLKTQAVISRTYALKQLGKHSKEGFDLCDATHCQVYGGVDIESPKTNEAVDETRGEVLFYEGKLASTFFHGSCGGHTENIEYVWGTKAPAYLKGRAVKYSNGYQKEFWRNKISASLIREKLGAQGYNLGKVDKIKIAGRTGSGRAMNLKVYGKNKTIEVNAAKFRLWVDPWKIRSTLFEDIQKKDDWFEFSGVGWGHGVGLCQESAKNMANKGFSFEKILKYFYPGTYLAKWDEQE